MKFTISLILFVLFETSFSQDVLVKNQHELLSSSINCIVADEYALWIGSNKGINRLEILKDSITQVSARQTTKPVLSVCNDHNSLWVGIKGKGLYLFNKKSYVFKGKFKKELSAQNISFLEKKGSLLFVLTEKKESFVINLKDSTIKGEKHSFNYSSTKAVMHKGTKYQVSENGIVTLSSASSEIVTVIKETLDDSINVEEIDSNQLIEKQVSLENKTDAIVVDRSERKIDTQDKLEACKTNWLMENLWSLIPMMLLYTFILVKVLSMKYKKDIRILEDEVLKMKSK